MHITRRKKRKLFRTSSLGSLFFAAACGLVGLSSSGVCVSEPVSFSFGLRVYCYNDFDEDECRDYNAQNVNGAAWVFHSGQTCGDRDLTTGSNAWP